MALVIKLHEGKPGDTYHPKSKKLGKYVWSLENLNVDDGDTGIVYNPDNGECYYNQFAARRVSSTIPGWHLPTPQEFEDLADYLSEGTLGDDDFTTREFAIKLVGESDTIGKPTFMGVGETATFWTRESCVNATLLDYPQELVVGKDSNSYGDAQYMACSVRLVKD